MTQAPQPAPATAADAARFQRALAAIDAANARDPAHIDIRGTSRPKELAHAELLSAVVQSLRPDAPEPLLLAARAHHIERWRIPRSTYPPGRNGYLRWRRDLHAFHAKRAGEILRACGYDDATIERVAEIVRKHRLQADPDVQALEDGLCIVFLETQLDDLGDRIDDDKMVTVLQKTWRKMSPAGQQAALGLDLSEHGRRLVERALAEN